jgi:acetoin utilization protein AcuB
MNVGTIMTRHVVTIGMDDSVRKVRDIFASMKFHHLVVVEHGKVVGVVSARDLLKNLSPFLGTLGERTQDLTVLRRKVHQIMTRRLVSVTEETTLREAGSLMLEHRVSCLPVLDASGACVGILTQHDLLSWALVQCAGGDQTCPVGKKKAA